MDPLAVLRTLWRQKWFALPALALAIGAAAFVYLEGPRVHESSQSFALIAPDAPTEKEIDDDPTLLELNSDNPYLRSSDPTLVVNALITRLNSQEAADRMAAVGVTGEFSANPGAFSGGHVVTISAAGASPEETVASIDALGGLLDEFLRGMQTVNGADDRFLYTSITITSPSKPVERLSSRMRNVAVVGIGGAIVLFGAVSLGTWASTSRERRDARGQDGETEPAAQRRKAHVTTPPRA